MGEITYTYDANGHTTSKTEDGTTTVYEYNLDERMSTVRIDGGAILGQYEYDPFGRRTKKVTAYGTRYFHYDDTGLLAEYDTSGNLINEYQYKPGSTWMTNPLLKRDSANKLHYYYNSHLGQPLKLFDRSGRITWEGRSQAFGSTTILIEETENNLRFPGQYEDKETGLFYNLMRYYDYRVGRYLRYDPIGLEGGLNVYAYAENSPLIMIDQLGLNGWAGMPVPYNNPTDGRVVSEAARISNEAQSRAGREIAQLAKTARPGVFGCIGGCVTYVRGDSGATYSIEPTIGGGIMICSPPPPGDDKSGSCESESDEEGEEGRDWGGSAGGDVRPPPQARGKAKDKASGRCGWCWGFV